jgi:ATP-dependent Lon protease
VGVMILPEVTLFPQALLPLFIFEPRYRRMLADSLASHRLFAVAMLRPGSSRESPASVGGLGLVRVAVDNPDGTAHLMLQGLTRIELGGVVRYKPYRVHNIRPLTPVAPDGITTPALLATIKKLVQERIQLESSPSPGQAPQASEIEEPPEVLPTGPSGFLDEKMISYLNGIHDADTIADLVSWSLLSRPLERQEILETVDIEPRLRRLIHFLMAEIRQRRKNGGDERP